MKYQHVPPLLLLFIPYPILYVNHVFAGAASDMKKAEVVGRQLHIIWTHLLLFACNMYIVKLLSVVWENGNYILCGEQLRVKLIVGIDKECMECNIFTRLETHLTIGFSRKTNLNALAQL